MAELYSTLTRMPGRHRVTAEQALLFLASVRERLALISLTSEEYVDAIEAAARMGITGGGIYDALLARCAVKAQAEVVYSWNVRHYTNLGDAVSSRLQTP